MALNLQLSIRRQYMLIKAQSTFSVALAIKFDRVSFRATLAGANAATVRKQDTQVRRLP
jgi:hypothetical protein